PRRAGAGPPERPRRRRAVRRARGRRRADRRGRGRAPRARPGGVRPGRRRPPFHWLRGTERPRDLLAARSLTRPLNGSRTCDNGDAKLAGTRSHLGGSAPRGSTPAERPSTSVIQPLFHRRESAMNMPRKLVLVAAGAAAALALGSLAWAAIPD